LARLRAIAPAVLLLSGLFTVWAGPLAAPVAAASGDWTQFRNGPTHQGYNTAESTISAENVDALGVAWMGATGRIVNSSPVASGGVVYVGSTDGMLYAYDAYALLDCSGSPKACTPLWTAVTGDSIEVPPAVSNGVVYVGSLDGKLYAYAVGCNFGGQTCSPGWTASTGAAIWSSPTIAGGVLYVGSNDHNLYAFDAAGVSGCSGTAPNKTCTPLWTAATGGDPLQAHDRRRCALRRVQ